MRRRAGLACWPAFDPKDLVIGEEGQAREGHMDWLIPIFFIGSVVTWAVFNLVRIRVKNPASWWASMWWASILGAVVCGLFSLVSWFVLVEMAWCIFGRKWEHFSNIQDLFLCFLGYVAPFLWLLGPLAAAAWLLTKPDGWKKFLQVPLPAPSTETKLFHCSRCKAVLFGQETTCPQCGVELTWAATTPVGSDPGAVSRKKP
jgi:hypothetical protein